MNAEMIQDGVLFVGMVLSFTLLLRARRIAAGLWFAETSHQRLCNVDGAKRPVEMDRAYRA